MGVVPLREGETPFRIFTAMNRVLSALVLSGGIALLAGVPHSVLAGAPIPEVGGAPMQSVARSSAG